MNYIANVLEFQSSGRNKDSQNWPNSDESRTQYELFDVCCYLEFAHIIGC